MLKKDNIPETQTTDTETTETIAETETTESQANSEPLKAKKVSSKTKKNSSDNSENNSPAAADSNESQASADDDVSEKDSDKDQDSAPVETEKTEDDTDSEKEKQEESKVHTLRASSLYKMFGKKKVVQGIDFEMKTGEVLGLLGPNGAGKTTTFYMIVGFYQPTRGEIFLDDQRITPLPMYKRARLGISYLPQEPSVFRKLTVEENIWSILETRNDLSYKEKRRRLEELIEEFSIGRIRKQQAFTLSGGERRRTEIARSLAIEPKFLLLDEPFAGIDPIAVNDIKSMIKLLSKRGIGILITDHNVRDTLEITDRAIIVSTGQILIQGSQQDIIDSPVAREIYLGENFHM